MTGDVEIISPARLAWATKLNAQWDRFQGKTVQGILDLGAMLLEARHGPKKLPHGEFGAMVANDLKFSRPSAHAFMKIASNGRFVQYIEHLPPHWGTLAPLCRLDDQTFDALIADGTINSKLQQKDIMRLLRARARARRYGELVDLPLPTDAPVHVLYADPPWRYENPPMGDSGRSIENQYPTMTLEEIASVNLGACALPDALLFLWATAPKLAECMTLLEPWGFTYRTNLVWDKLEIGMGYYARNQHELLLIARRGSIPPPEEYLRPASVYRERVGEHSAKPIYYYELIERCFPGLRKREFFSRAPARPGWLEPWGNQVRSLESAA